jgi:hypothetical protein
MYQINIYTHDMLEQSTVQPTEGAALAYAYARIGTNGVRVAHVLKTGTQSGIFIARHTDLDRATLPALIHRLRATAWR